MKREICGTTGARIAERSAPDCVFGAREIPSLKIVNQHEASSLPLARNDVKARHLTASRAPVDVHTRLVRKPLFCKRREVKIAADLIEGTEENYKHHRENRGACYCNRRSPPPLHAQALPSPIGPSHRGQHPLRQIHCRTLLFPQNLLEDGA